MALEAVVIQIIFKQVLMQINVAFFTDEMKSSPVFGHYHLDRETAYYCKRSVKLSDTLDAFP